MSISKCFVILCLFAFVARSNTTPVSEAAPCSNCGTESNVASFFCSIDSCSAGYDDCDNSIANGCEINLESDTSNCGACSNSCPTPSNTVPSCTSGSCSSSCSAGFSDCTADPGCETNSASDTNNCGACSNVCPTPSNTVPSCTSGSCSSSCSAGYSNCDANPDCEIHSDVDTNNCGACGDVCSYANGSPSCSSGTCSLASCTSGFSNCDEIDSNGCEASLSSTSTCGSCGTSCTLTSNVDTVVCGAGGCEISGCADDFFDCDSIYSNGCEVSFTPVQNTKNLVFEDLAPTANYSDASSAGAVAYNNVYHHTGSYSAAYNPSSSNTFEIICNTAGCINTAITPALSLWTSGGKKTGGGQQLTFNLIKAGSVVRSVPLSTNDFRVGLWSFEFVVLVSNAAPAGLYDGFSFTSSTTQAVAYFDQIHLVQEQICTV